MLHYLSPNMGVRSVTITICLCTCATSAATHEAWLLTPQEIITLAAAPIPPIFTSRLVLCGAATLGLIATVVALALEGRIQRVEAMIAPKLGPLTGGLGPLFLRLAIGAMLLLAGTGGLPRHGTVRWVEPTLLVPDMQLSLVPGWGWLAAVQIGVALFLMIGLYTRLLAFVVMGLVAIGLAIFDAKFIAYAPHFVAPALILLLTGAGRFSLDWAIDIARFLTPPADVQQFIWRAAQVLIGAGFVYLAVVYKLTQPTLLIAILQHGDLPTFGLSYPVIALVMTGVEIICGALLIVGRLVRPVSLVIIGAITFLAVTLGETPLFHGNLYGAMLIFVLIGRDWPACQQSQTTKKALTT